MQTIRPAMTETADEQILQTVQDTMREFKEGARLHNEEGKRIARRTAQIVRWSFVGMVLLGLALLTLLVLLTKSLVTATERIDGIHDYTKSMSVELQSVSGDMGRIAGRMSTIAGSMGRIEGEMGRVRKRLDTMNAHVSGLEGSVGTIPQELQVINGQLNGIGKSMGRITHDMSQMSRPMQMMPWP